MSERKIEKIVIEREKTTLENKPKGYIAKLYFDNGKTDKETLIGDEFIIGNFVVYGYLLDRRAWDEVYGAMEYIENKEDADPMYVKEFIKFLESRKRFLRSHREIERIDIKPYENGRRLMVEWDELIPEKEIGCMGTIAKKMKKVRIEIEENQPDKKVFLLAGDLVLEIFPKNIKD
jgi:hypothetical protein